MVRKPTITETIWLNRLCWFGHVDRMQENRIPKKVLYMNLETTRLRGRPRNRWQDELKEDGRLVGGKGWKERICNREEWKKLLRTARDSRILHMPMEWVNGIVTVINCTLMISYCSYLVPKVSFSCSSCFWITDLNWPADRHAVQSAGF
jgi:hypothetical protein